MDRSFVVRRLCGLSLLLGSLAATLASAEEAALKPLPPAEPARLPATPSRPLDVQPQPAPAAPVEKPASETPAAAEGNVYRPISLIAMESENAAPVTPNRWILSRTEIGRAHV